MLGDVGFLENLQNEPFSQSTNLSANLVRVLRACIRSIKATDEISRPVVENLTAQQAQELLDSDVVRTVVQAEMPRNLAAFALELLAKEFDLVARRDWHAKQEAQRQAEHFADNPTFGMF